MNHPRLPLGIIFTVLVMVLALVPTVTAIAEDPPMGGDAVGLVDPTQGRWHLKSDTGVVNSFYFGNPGDTPFLGDWDCDGVATPGLFRTSDAFAYLRNSNTQGNADIRFFFGNPSDVPLAGDFNGDGCDTLSIYRPSNQTFYIVNKLGENEGGLGAAEYSFMFGNPGDKPVVGDWDGDRIDEIGLHRETTGFFYYRNTLTTGIADGQFFFGDPGDRFVAGDWGIVDGVETPAMFRPSNSTFYFRHTLTQGNADSQFTWNGAGSSWLPVAGDFTAGMEPKSPVTVVGQRPAEDLVSLVAEFSLFTAETGIDVRYIQHDDPGGLEYLAADVTILNQGFFGERELAAEFLVDLGMYEMPGKLRADFGDGLIDPVTISGKILGVPIEISPKSLVWYQPSTFTDEGYRIPTTFAELVALSNAMVTDGHTPWCNYIGSDGATGWIGTDWVEDLLLGAEGPAVYDDWVDNTVAFEDPRVETAFNRYVQMIDTPGYVFDRDMMLDLPFFDNVEPLVSGDCLMHRQAAFFGNMMGSEQIEKLDTFKFPSVAPAFADAVVGGTMYASALTNSEEVDEFMRFLMGVEFGTQIAADGDRAWLLPNLGFDHNHYAYPLSVEWAELTGAAQAADLFRADASDLMPWDTVNMAFWEGITDLVSHDATVPEVLAAIDEAWLEPEPEPVLHVVLPDGDLDGSGFAPHAVGFEYLLGDDPNNEDNWHAWVGSSGDEDLNMPGVVAGAAVGDWVGIRNVAEGQEAIHQIVAFTFDSWDGSTASGTIDAVAASGVVAVCWWDPLDPENNWGCDENNVGSGTWQVDGLGGSVTYDPLAYFQADDSGNLQVIPYPFP